MYQYDQYDQRIVDERVAQFRAQTSRYLKGQLSEEEFLPLRLQNGLYIQRLAPMLRVAIPYGLLSSAQLRALAKISREYDKGYGHISTRQNIQFNWPQLEEVPDILAALAKVQMHAIQTSGNCIRNITTDQFAGIAPDEIEDPRPWCELIRQWACFHPEFAFLPRKFKIAVTASKDDRAAVAVHDIGIRLMHDQNGGVNFQILVGGGLGRTPAIGEVIYDCVPPEQLLGYLEAILRVYNLHGRRDNRYKARIKILLKAMGAQVFKQHVDEAWEQHHEYCAELDPKEIERVRSCFHDPQYDQVDLPAAQEVLAQQRTQSPEFDRWVRQNVGAHKISGYAIATVSLKDTGEPPGDLSDAQMEFLADCADRFSFGQLRTTHEQNIVLGSVRISDLFALWEDLSSTHLASANIHTLNDIICCPGGDYCSLANAKSIPIAEAIQRRFEDWDYLYDLGNIDLNISGCMNACGHHHVGHIGILGVDKKGAEFYQISLGGNAGRYAEASLGQILGPSFSCDEVPDVIAKILTTYTEQRQGEESFLDTYKRLGIECFRERVYA